MTDYKCVACELRPESIFKCSRCKGVKYCTTDCHRKYWEVHKKACYSVREREVTNKLLRDEGSYLCDTIAKGIIGSGCTLPQGVSKTFLYKIRAWNTMRRSPSLRLLLAHATD